MDFKIPSHEKNIAVALSGGGDSMTLAHMICTWAVERNIQVHLLTVNHNLRDEAEAEAAQVGASVAKFPNAHHVILTWDYDEKPATAIMELARVARYDLMTNYCHAHDIQTVCVAHHADDNLETFLFRLAKGSGLDGLTGMDEWGDNNDIKIYRPLLNMTHNELIFYCKNNNLNWIEDVSNENENYARPRLRKALANEGLDAKRFTKTLERLSRAQDALNWMATKTIQNVVHPRLDRGSRDDDKEDPRLRGEGIDLNFHELKSHPIDIQIRVLQKLISDLGVVTHAYPPKLERIEDIIATIKPNKSATLHGCVLSLSKDGNTLEIKRS